MAPAAASSRSLDLVLFGATGFTGRLTAAYLARHAPPSLRWAIAGRDAAKLEALRAALAASHPEAAARMSVVTAATPDALVPMARSTRVVITTAGPFALHGEPLVRACAEAGTAYADITGETAWVQSMARKYGDAARKSGAVLVSCCGFDSVPADLGVFTVAAHARAVHGHRLARVVAVMTGSGNVSGGTIASVFNLMRSPAAQAASRDPYCLFPREEAAAAGTEAASIVAPTPDVRPIPFWEPVTRTYAAAFVMAAVNTRIVRRSAGLFALEARRLAGRAGTLPALRGAGAAGNSGRDALRYASGAFEYSEYMGTRGLAAAVGMNVALGVGMAVLTGVPGALSCAARFVPQPGEGPSAEARAKARFRYYLIGRTEGAGVDSPARRVVGRVSGGDGGYDETSKMLGEAGLALALKWADLPASAMGGGFLTPAVAFGSVLTDALNAAGLKFEIVSDDVAPPEDSE